MGSVAVQAVVLVEEVDLEVVEELEVIESMHVDTVQCLIFVIGYFYVLFNYK